MRWHGNAAPANSYRRASVAVVAGSLVAAITTGAGAIAATQQPDTTARSTTIVPRHGSHHVVAHGAAHVEPHGSQQVAAHGSQQTVTHGS